MKRIGILGGTFDPIHNIHIEIAKEAMKQYCLDEVILIPAKYPPNKLGKKISKDKDRLAMIKLAVKGLVGISVSDLELNRDKVSFTSETLMILSEKFPQNELYFIVGGDSVTYIEDWYHPEIIFEKAHILYAVRSGDGKEKVEHHIETVLKPRYKNMRISEISFRETKVSSSEIRSAVEKGKIETVKNEIHPDVFHYIVEHGLYCEAMGKNYGNNADD